MKKLITSILNVILCFTVAITPVVLTAIPVNAKEINYNPAYTPDQLVPAWCGTYLEEPTTINTEINEARINGVDERIIASLYQPILQQKFVEDLNAYRASIGNTNVFTLNEAYAPQTISLATNRQMYGAGKGYTSLKITYWDGIYNNFINTNMAQELVDRYSPEDGLVVGAKEGTLETLNNYFMNSTEGYVYFSFVCCGDVWFLYPTIVFA